MAWVGAMQIPKLIFFMQRTYAGFPLKPCISILRKKEDTKFIRTTRDEFFKIRLLFKGDTKLINMLLRLKCSDRSVNESVKGKDKVRLNFN
jgi:hypothetical protein